MALTRTAAVLTTMVRNRADHLVGTFRADAVLYQYLSDSCRSLVGLLVAEYGEMYWASEDFIQTTIGQESDAAPADFWKLITTRVNIGSERRALDRIDLDRFDAIPSELDTHGWASGVWPGYRLMGGRFVWAPTPQAAHQVKLYYVSTEIFKDNLGNGKSDLTAANDTFDGVFGWDRWVALDSAIKLLNDEKKDPSALLRERDDRYAEIVAEASNQDADKPDKVRDRWDPSDGAYRSGRMPPGGWY